MRAQQLAGAPQNRRDVLCKCRLSRMPRRSLSRRIQAHRPQQQPRHSKYWPAKHGPAKFPHHTHRHTLPHSLSLQDLGPPNLSIKSDKPNLTQKISVVHSYREPSSWGGSSPHLLWRWLRLEVAVVLDSDLAECSRGPTRANLTNERWPTRTQTTPGAKRSNALTGHDCRSHAVANMPQPKFDGPRRRAAGHELLRRDRPVPSGMNDRPMCCAA